MIKETIMRVILFLMLCASVFGAITGSGTSGDPWVIPTEADWNTFAGTSTYWDEATDYVQLGADLDDWSGSGGNITPCDKTSATFEAQFDGQGYVIANGTIVPVADAQNHNGLIEKLGASATVENLTITDCTITADATNAAKVYCGMISGETTYGSTIKNCTVVNPTVSATSTHNSFDAYIGGLVGAAHGDIIGCNVVGGTVKGKHTGTGTTTYGLYIGGLIGLKAGDGSANPASMMKDCISSTAISDVSAGTTMQTFYGGVAGGVWTGTNNDKIERCIFTGSITSSAAVDSYVGGVTGFALGQVIDCVCLGSITASSTDAQFGVGGIIGTSTATGVGPVSGCSSVSTLNVTSTAGNNTGGIVGNTATGCTIDVINCSYIGSINITDTTAGGLVLAGGIAGYPIGGDFDSCYSWANLAFTTVPTDKAVYAGGGCGRADSGVTFDDCLVRGTVLWGGDTDLTTNSSSYDLGIWGGFIGYTNGADITNCIVAVGPNKVSGGNQEGFAGLNTAATITNCYWDTDVASHTSAASGDGTASTTAELQTGYVSGLSSQIWVQEADTYPELLLGGNPAGSGGSAGSYGARFW